MHIRELRVALLATFAGLLMAAGVGAAATPTPPTAATQTTVAAVAPPVHHDHGHR
jgi:hypothetical protein